METTMNQETTPPPVQGYVDTQLAISLKIAREQPFGYEDTLWLYSLINEYFNPLQTNQLTPIDPPRNEVEYQLLIEAEFPFSVCVDHIDNQLICQELYDDPNLIESWERTIVEQLARVPHHSCAFSDIKIEEVYSMKVAYIDLETL